MAGVCVYVCTRVMCVCICRVCVCVYLRAPVCAHAVPP